jgi:hypothetical protein
MELVAVLPPQWPGSGRRLGYVGFMVDEVTLGRVFYEYLDTDASFNKQRKKFS